MTAMISINLELKDEDFTERPEILQAMQILAGLSKNTRTILTTEPKRESAHPDEPAIEPIKQEKQAKQETPDPVSESTVTAAELRGLAAAKTKANSANRAKVKELLDLYNAPSVSNVAKKDYADFYADLELLED